MENAEFGHRVIDFSPAKQMGFANNVGRYQIGRTIGEGTFAKVKLAVDSTNGQHVAVKVIDKCMVMESDLMLQACSCSFNFNRQ
ncbi:Tyrosine-protein kinase [Parasponia andersonii]|uniref:Tyrosine-protein kinase n=1 Tax=Parasponia andersonii TaxID=3476 RepID=A0A2P5AB86_PARAD|nr:Tyrosine-protein kinase [Parasponia andersonii]